MQTKPNIIAVNKLVTMTTLYPDVDGFNRLGTVPFGGIPAGIWASWSGERVDKSRLPDMASDVQFLSEFVTNLGRG